MRIFISFVAVLGAILLLLTGFFGTGNIFLYLNFKAIAIVIGGTLIATFISFPPTKVLSMFKTIVDLLFTKTSTPEEVVEILLDLSVRSKMEGILALQNLESRLRVPIISQALGLLIDGYKPEEIRDVLLTQMQFLKIRHAEGERIFRLMASFAPAFGLIGSIAGLIMITTGIAEEEVIQLSVGICLLSTMYGILLANAILLPIAEMLKRRTNKELLLQRIALDGILAIQEETNPHKLEMKLKAFLSPRERKTTRLPTVEELQKRFKLEKQEG